MTETQFGIQFVVTRDGKPITDVITVETMTLNLHERHDRKTVWEHHAKVLAELMRDKVNDVDALTVVVPDTHLVGLGIPKPRQNPGTPPSRERGTVKVKGVDASYHIREKLGTPILKVINRVLLALVKRLTAYNAKRGKH